MRRSPGISIFLAATLFVYPLTAQETKPQSAPREPSHPIGSETPDPLHPKTPPPSSSLDEATQRKLLNTAAVFWECELGQCKQGGGGLWVIYRFHGQGIWPNGIEASLTLDQYDGKKVLISRTSRGLTAQYTGAVDSLWFNGSVVFNGDTAHPGKWAALKEATFCQRAQRCGLSIPQILQLASNALKAHQMQVAYAAFNMASEQGNPDAKGFIGEMLMTGYAPQPDISEGVRLLRESADAGSYFGQEGLAQAYENGMGVEKNLQEAKSWHTKADATKQRLKAEAEQKASDKALQATVAIAAAIILGIIAIDVITGGGSGGSTNGSSNRPASHSFDSGAQDRRECYWAGNQAACDRQGISNPHSQGDD